MASSLTLRMPRLAGAFAVAMGVASLGAAPARAEKLTIGLGGSVNSLDPHFYSTTPNNLVAFHIFDRLVDRMADGKLAPGLATAWRATSPTVWEFTLREGVTWHDGKPFTADDVAFTLKRALDVPNNLGGFAGIIRPITGVEVAGPLLIRLTTATPIPNLPSDLTRLAIVSRHAGQDATTADYNSGKAAIGTGPFKFSAYQPGERIELVANDTWWGKKPAWTSVTLRLIPNVAVRTAALLAGDIDVIDQPSASDLPRLQSSDKVKVAEIAGMRVNYVVPMIQPAPDAPAVLDKKGAKIEPSPLTKQKVREALSLAINRAGITERVVLGTATPTGQWLPAGIPGYDAKTPVPAYDVQKAKKLLGEAGFPDGFRLTLSTANDRTPYSVEVAQALAQMWSRIGVEVAIDAMPFSVYSTRGAKSQFSAYLGSWSNNSMEGTGLLRDLLATRSQQTGWGLYNWAQYSNPALDALTTAAISETDEARREKLVLDAVKLVSSDVAIIPLYHFKNIWATRAALRYDPRIDELTLATDVHKAGK
ncbi:ABC transporter substrate-binding protein [Bosea psychrotolerans]|uniref:Peptide/nickel transport system substrate-binding protein n=1 Tax=Bosea psychrotolerans TaxID=1871628 RepID=A0A2S4LSH6_9HYPH|nr:ABC transporter substrate-binding protein [Bosea psychrotolerans]POR45299.1 peptide/nickel transport system substrate-binding protein [Bosea psychrotolerans]